MRKETSKPNFIANEKEMLKFWKDNKCFEKLVEKNKGHERFKFLDGPITANNRCGVHHIWGRTLKDITIKYKYDVVPEINFKYENRNLARNPYGRKGKNNV